MSQIQAPSGMQKVEPEEVPRFVDLFFQDLVRVINGGLDFGNFNAKQVSVTFTSANTDTLVTHGLKRQANGYIVTSLNGNMVIYSGTATGDKNTLNLKSSATGTAGLLIF